MSDLWNDICIPLYEGKCVLCLEPGSHPHHIIPVGLGGTDDEDNIAPLCTDCHTMVHHVGATSMERIIRERARVVRKAFADGN